MVDLREMEMEHLRAYNERLVRDAARLQKRMEGKRVAWALSVDGWTDDEVTLLSSMWLNGNSASVIARALTDQRIARTRNAVIGKVHRLGLSGKQPNKRDPLKDKQKRTPSPLIAKAAPTPEPLPVVPPPKPPRPVGRMLLWDAPDNACRWPMWGLGANEPRIVCSEPVLGAHVYCEAHCLRAYEPPKPVLAKQIYRTTGANR